MINIIVRYKVKRKNLKKVVSAVKKFVEEVRKNEKGTLRYEAYQEKDKTKFVHIMTFKDNKSKKIHENTDYLEKFVDVVYPLCVGELKFFRVRKV